MDKLDSFIVQIHLLHFFGQLLNKFLIINIQLRVVQAADCFKQLYIIMVVCCWISMCQQITQNVDIFRYVLLSLNKTGDIDHA